MTERKTAAEIARKYGLTLQQVVNYTGFSRSGMQGWAKSAPKKVHVICAGVARLIEEDGK